MLVRPQEELSLVREGLLELDHLGFNHHRSSSWADPMRKKNDNPRAHHHCLGSQRGLCFAPRGKQSVNRQAIDELKRQIPLMVSFHNRPVLDRAGQYPPAPSIGPNQVPLTLEEKEEKTKLDVHGLGCKRLESRRKLTPTTKVNGAMEKTTRVSVSITIPAAITTRLRESAAPATASIAANNTPPGTMAAIIAVRAFDSVCTLRARQASCGPTWTCTGCSGGNPSWRRDRRV